jgi:hypothetical protein
MPNVLHHGLAAAIACVISAGAYTFMPPREITHRVTEQVNHTVNASKHAWPDLTDAQKVGLAGSLKLISAGRGDSGDAVSGGAAPLKLAIICGDGACTDLAQDIDDAAELAGVDSVLDRPFSALGYGVGVQAEAGDARGPALAAVLSDVIGGPVAATIGSTRMSGYPVWIVIGKHPKH